MQVLSKFAKAHWQLAVVLLLIFSQLILIFSGHYIVKIEYWGIIFYLTVPAVIMTVYKTWQKVLSHPYIRKKMRESRQPIVDELKKDYPALATDLDDQMKKFILLPTFRKNIFNLGITEDNWIKCVNRTFPNGGPLASICVPIYRIAKEILYLQVKSMYQQYYGKIHYIYLGVNDALDIETYEYLRSITDRGGEFGDSSIKFDVLIEPAKGKREVQNTMFNKAKKDGCEIIIHMDGDGFADPNAVDRHVWALLSNPKAAIVTGYVEALNKTENMITRVIFIKYNVAFMDERGANSSKGENSVPSGPNFAMWVWFLDLVQELWFLDEFMGIRMTFGDDRAFGFFLQLLTLIIAPNPRKAVEELKKKDKFWIGLDHDALDRLVEKIESMARDLMHLESDYTPESIVYTDVPTSIEEYDPQQIRWSTSYWIYTIRTYLVGIWAKLSFYSRNSIAYLTFYPFIVISSLFVVVLTIIGAILSQEYGVALRVFAYYSGVIVAVHWLFFSVTGFWLTRDWTFWLSPLHFGIWLRVQPKAKVISLKEAKNRDWRTRKK